MIFVCIIVSFVILGLISTYICYRLAFTVNKKQSGDPYFFAKISKDPIKKEKMLKLIKEAVDVECDFCETDSFDGLKLCARLYEREKTAPVQILMHGYSSNARGDFAGGLRLALEQGCNVILPDERAHNGSEGKCLSFGVLERHDVLSWVNFALEHFGKDCEIVLVGISMGAATVLMASDLELPPNVKGIIADCGYSSPSAIIRKVTKDRHYPSFAVSLVRAGGRLFGGFDIESASAVKSLKHCNVPVLFIHGENDNFVPCEMSRENYEACACEKYLETFPNAGHGVSYLEDTERYRCAVGKFLDGILRER